MSKIEISVACREENLIEAISECLAIQQAVDFMTIEMKVKFNASTDPGVHISAWRYVTVHKDSRPNDILEIYNLKKELNKDSYFTNSKD